MKGCAIVKKCYIYTRVSTEIQVDGYSLEAQEEALKKEAKHRNMKVAGVYCDDGKSGKNISGRPAFKNMLDDIVKNKDGVDYVLVFKLSRFGRNAADTLNSLQLMEDYGVNLLCVKDGIDSAGASGKLIISVLASVAEIERENIKEQTMAGRQQKARDGKWNGGFAPYGYKLVPKEDGREKLLVIEPEEAELVKLIYKKYLEGLGINSVVKYFKDNNIQKKVRQKNDAPYITEHFVKGILDNPVYMGKIAYGRRRTEKIEGTRNEYHIVKQSKDSYQLYDGKHEAIITEDDWYRAQAMREKTSFVYPKQYGLEHAHLLSGLLKCPKCGAPMYGVVNRKKRKVKDKEGNITEETVNYWYYRCKNRKLVDGKYCDYKKQIIQEEIDNEIKMLVSYLFLGENNITNKIYNAAKSKDAIEKLETEKQTLVKRCNSLKQKIEKQSKRIAMLDYDPDDELYDDIMKSCKDYLKELKKDEKTLTDEIDRKQLELDNAKRENISSEFFREVIDGLLNGDRYLDDAEKKLLMQLLIDRIEIYPEKQKGENKWVKKVRFKIALNIAGEQANEVGLTQDEEGEKINIFLPNSNHVETVCLLSKLHEAKHHVNVRLDMDEMDLTAAERR